jgi:hypothetical protein
MNQPVCPVKVRIMNQHHEYKCQNEIPPTVLIDVPIEGGVGLYVFVE